MARFRGPSVRGPAARVRDVVDFFRPEPWTITLNGQERRVRGWAYPILVLLGAPAVVVVAAAAFAIFFAVAVAFIGILLALPALAFGWLLSTPEPSSAASRSPLGAINQEEKE